MSKKYDWQSLASKLFCLCVAATALFLVGKYLVSALLPFLIALGIAAALRPLVALFTEKSGLPKKLCAALILIFLFLIVSALLTFAVKHLLGELTKLPEKLSGVDISARLSLLLDQIRQLPIVGELLEGELLSLSLTELLSSIGKNLTLTLTGKLPNMIGILVSKLPSLLLFFVITVMATFYFTLDFETITSFCISLLPTSFHTRLPDLKRGTGHFLLRYLRAYTILLFLTFCELYVGFTVLALEYRFLPALFISLVDIFPVLGVGTVLLPWAAVSFVSGNHTLGLGLLIVWGAVTLVRQIIEPRILGGTLGLHPMPMLIGMYIGYRFFGIIGILSAPAVLMLLRFGLRELQSREQKKMERRS